MNRSRIICNISPDYDPSKHDGRSNPIAAYLQSHLAEPLAHAFREEAQVDDALVLIDFTFEEFRGEVKSMCLSFNVRSWGRDILEDVLFLKIFQRIVRSFFNTRRIMLEHTPNNGFGLAEYKVCDIYSMLALLKAIDQTDCDTKSTFAIVLDDDDWDANRKARIGFFGYGMETRFEMYVRTDDECKVPHVHIRDMWNTKRNIAVTLHGANYYPHCHCEDKLEKYELEYLDGFMREPCRSPKFANNYELAVCMWNTQNRTQYRCDKDGRGQIIVPDYIATSAIEKREYAVSHGLQIQYDNLYITRMNNEIKNRNWV